MCLSQSNKFKYNHEVWVKYSFSQLGYDMYRAKFASSIPSRPIYFTFGKWFVDLRFFKWQVLINKLNKVQLDRLKLSLQLEEKPNHDAFNNTNHFSF